MDTLYININGENTQNTENITVVGRPEDAIINKFYSELVKGIVKGLTVPGIGEVKNRRLVTDFEAYNEKAFAKIMEQWDIVKQQLLGENPIGTYTVTLPQEYVEWLYNHGNDVYNKIAPSLASRGNAVEISIEKIYKNAIGLFVNNIDLSVKYDSFTVNDDIVDDDSKISEDIRKRVDNSQLPFMNFFEWKQTHEKAAEPEHKTEDKPEDSQEQCGDSVFKVKRQRDGIVFKVKNTSFVMKHIMGGSFLMGSADRDEFKNKKPVHSVTVSSFYMGETEVTQALWKTVMGSNPSYFKGDELPVEKVSWNDCQEFIRKLNQITGWGFRLPTEAEWEYAARGGKLSEGFQYSGSDDIDDVAWYGDNSGDETHPVKEKSPNELGLYDMSGNVWEWCSDWYDSDYYSVSPSSNPKGPLSGSFRVYRGGSWFNSEGGILVSMRNFGSLGKGDNCVGFRLVFSQ